MPHIHLETTADLSENAEIPQILEALVDRLSTAGAFASRSVKAYHTLRPVWTMGNGAPGGFAHCTVSILSGRTMEERQSLVQAIYEVMKRSFDGSLRQDEVSLTLELREMAAETYQKMA